MIPDDALLTDILSARAAADPDRVAYRFLDDDGAEADHLTYRGLHTRARSLAAALRARCAAGDRALLVFPPGLDFVIAYFGCLYAGMVAVPLSPPRRGVVREATRAVVRDCAPAAVLTVDWAREALRPALAPLCPGAWWLGVESADGHGEAEPAPIGPDTVAFLQYTSGSTGAPKGVMISHRNLIANQRMIRDAFGHDRDSTVVGWAPFFHDQGLIGNVLQPLYVGATSVLMSPATFVRRPLRWLEAISAHRAHSSGGPNFAFEACVERAAGADLSGLDLSSWRVAFNGAEPIRADTIARFTETFAPCGFRPEAMYPCYGLAEATLLVSGAGRGRGPRTVVADVDALGAGRLAPARASGRALVGSGAVLAGETVRVVDPVSTRRLPEGRVGEIWVRGDHVSRGYWQRPATTAERLRARRADEDGEWLRTGDLGALHDGELFVVGRRDDLMIVRGRNHYPQDVEATAQAAHPAVRTGAVAAFTVSEAGSPRLIVVAEIRRERLGAHPAEVAGALRAAVLREHDLAVGNLVLTVPGEVERTSSGKIMRAAARARYTADGFTRWPVAPAVTTQRSSS
ncbi:fatty acyl-AMP ligase [Nocardia thailandica]